MYLDSVDDVALDIYAYIEVMTLQTDGPHKNIALIGLHLTTSCT